jgi:dTDP-glucose pyrophosphorylase
LIEYNLENAVSADVDEIIIVVGYKAEDIINAYGINYNGKPVRYVIQWEQRGLVHAIECSKDAIGDNDFMLFLGDEILIHPKHRLMIDKFEKEGLFGTCGIVVVEDRTRISKTYTIVQDGQDRIYRLIEKPKKPLNNMQGTGNCVFRNEILSYIKQTPINQQRGEKELPDLIQCAIDEGNIVKSFVICERYTNINSEDDLQEAELLFLE